MKQDELAEQSCDEICIHVGRILKDVMEAIVYIFSLTSIRFPFLWSPHSHPHIYINSHELIFVYHFWRASFVCSSDADCHQTHSIANHLFNISYSFLYYQYHCVGVVVWSFRYFNTAFELSFTGKLYKTLVFEFQSCVNVTFFSFFSQTTLLGTSWMTIVIINNVFHSNKYEIFGWMIPIPFFLHDIWLVSTKWKFSGR